MSERIKTGVGCLVGLVAMAVVWLAPTYPILWVLATLVLLAVWAVVAWRDIHDRTL